MAISQEMHKYYILLSALLLFFLYAGVVFHVYSPTESNETAPVFFVLEEPAITQLITPEVQIPELTRAAPLFPLSWSCGIFFDPITHKIHLPAHISMEYTSHNQAYYLHETTLNGASLPRRNRLYTLYSPLIINIEQNGDILNIRTRHGAIVRQNGSSIEIINLRDIYNKIVIIDPGHGGIDIGAPNVLGNSPHEADIVLAISQKVLDMFEHDPDILVIPTRTSNIFTYNANRYRLANRLAADYFISIHTNACDQSQNSNGTLTLYGQAPGSTELAYALQNSLVNALESRDRGTALSHDFRILNGSNVPVALLELLFISNPTEARRLADPATQQIIAETVAAVIRGEF